MPFRNQAIAALALLVMVASVAIGGHEVLRQQEVAFEEPEAIAQETITAEPPTATIPEKKAGKPPITSRAIDPEIVAPPQTGSEELERVDPRAPLSELALAMPPPPKTVDNNPDGTTLFQPMASAAGVIEAMGRTVTVSGIDAVALDETCTDGQGRQWACGLRARGAFRAFLRGRAPVCVMPPDSEAAATAPCHLGKQDIGAWLVSNGWARPTVDGPYVEAGEKAKAARKGIFGAAPDLSGLPAAPEPVEASPEAPSSILDLSGEIATPPADQPAPFQ
jgi:endonuclease YncB( thermonuclease family)